jgi:hypothetical protein
VTHGLANAGVESWLIGQVNAGSGLALD